ncbi:MAG: type II toxin-antitoxin system RelE/ParE family toxin [Thermoleophilia bacterium]|nr:type II toxin-antitoxin system RelE/ParE family toxin [Thermoleophilia bacterium]
MTLPVRFTPTADAEFLAVIAHIGADSPSAANAFKEKALHTLSRLGPFPESGRAVPEYPALPFREVIVAPYRFFYQVRVDAVWIVAVWHGAQLVDPPENGVSG